MTCTLTRSRKYRNNPIIRLQGAGEGKWQEQEERDAGTVVCIYGNISSLGFSVQILVKRGWEGISKVCS
uniref:Expressed protein n=1 Tax=Echinococcus granulosus TaxID=6210 RepID=A0A068WQV5_ECHGR|nr:expressed protein [Echinococcus granulosus]